LRRSGRDDLRDCLAADEKRNGHDQRGSGPDQPMVSTRSELSCEGNDLPHRVVSLQSTAPLTLNPLRVWKIAPSVSSAL